MKDKNKTLLGIMVLLVAAMYFGVINLNIPSGAQIPASVGGQVQQPSVPAALAGYCPVATSTVTVHALNSANTSSTTPYTAMTINAFEVNENEVNKNGVVSSDSSGTITVAATSAGGSITTLGVGKTYVLKPIRTDAANGQNSKILSTDYGTIEDGNLKIVVPCSGKTVNVKVTQHATLYFQLYDKAMARVYTNADQTVPSSSTWNLTGVTYESTVNASTTSGETLGAGDTLSRFIYVKTVQTDTEFTDRQGIIFVDADVSDYKEPTLKYNGVTLTNVKSQLTSDEHSQFDSTYEYVYFIPSSDTLNYAEDVVYLSVESASGVNPDANVVVAFGARGQYASGTSAKLGAAMDDATHTATYTMQTVTQQVA